MELAIARGLRNLTIDEIVRAAGMAKGTFYLHFASKEEFLFALLEDLHERLLRQVEGMVLEQGFSASRDALRNFILELFGLPEFSFFIKHHEELSELFEGSLGDRVRSLEEYEVSVYDKILRQAGADTNKVDSTVVLECIHMIFIGAGGAGLAADRNSSRAVGVLVDGLVAYVSGGFDPPEA